MAEVKEKVKLKIGGMDCSACAVTITRIIEKAGYSNVNVDFITGDAVFEGDNGTHTAAVRKSIEALGYKVLDEDDKGHGHSHAHHAYGRLPVKLIVSAAFSVPLLLHMFLDWAWLHDPYVQMVLAAPVFIIGLLHFGRSAWGSLKVLNPNMDVLIFIGSASAFLYSVAGILLHGNTHQVHQYLFFETSATIITLVLLGNLIESISVKHTTTAIEELSRMQDVPAKKVIRENGRETTVVISARDAQPGDLFLVNTGDRVPADGSVVSGSGHADESMISGESLPVEKNTGRTLTGGTLIVNGSVIMKAEKVGQDTFLSGVIRMVNEARAKRPSIQRLGDRISAIFVPIVLGISVLTFLLSYFILDKSLPDSFMPAIAVLVISCPCAMGLATPTAVMVGLGRAARQGILVKGGDTLESFAGVDTVVFDKTGTLTTGNIRIGGIKTYGKGAEKDALGILLALEKYSSHPIAKALVRELEGKVIPVDAVEVREMSGIGITAKDSGGSTIAAGSFRLPGAEKAGAEHDLYVTLNGELLAGVDLADEVRPEAADIIRRLRTGGIRTVMLSGDREKKCRLVAEQTGIEEVHAEKLPSEKLEIIGRLSETHKVAMVGDGVNDSPSLARAQVGIAIGSGTQVAIGSAAVVLTGEGDLQKLEAARLISKHTLITIRQNLFWAFFYNVIAIPIAAAGLLSPMIGALSMAFSDVIVIGNSIRLRHKKLH